MSADNPLQMADQNPPQENPEPNLVDWKQPFSTKSEPPTSAPANPPQPRGDQLTNPDEWRENVEPSDDDAEEEEEES